MIQSNTSSPWGQKYLLSPRRGDGSKVPQNKVISKGRKNGGEMESVLLSVEKERIKGA